MLEEKKTFSIDSFFAEDYESRQLVSFKIDALELANFLYQGEKLWVDIDTIYVKASLSDLYELAPEGKKFYDLVETDGILYKLPFEIAFKILNQLKSGGKYYEISTTSIPSSLIIHSSIESKNWLSAVADVKDNSFLQNDEFFSKRQIKKIKVIFHNKDDSLNETLLKKCLDALDFYKDKNIEYEYECNYNNAKNLIDKKFYFWPNCTNC